MNKNNQSQPLAPETLGLRPPRSSRHRYLKFVADYKQQRLDELNEDKLNEDALNEGDEEATESNEKPAEKKRASWQEAIGLKRGKRREYLREYLAWLWPYRYAVAVLATLALLTAALEMA